MYNMIIIHSCCFFMSSTRLDCDRLFVIVRLTDFTSLTVDCLTVCITLFHCVLLTLYSFAFSNNT